MKKTILLLLCLSLLLPIFSVAGSAYNTAKIPGDEEMTAEIASAYGGANGIVTMIFDDGNWDTAEWLNEKFKEYDLRGTCAMIMKYINDSNAKNWQALFADGYLEPESHSVNHIYLPNPNNPYYYDQYKQNNTDENYNVEIIESAKRIRQYFGRTPLCFIAPYNMMSPDGMEQYVKKQYYATRQGAKWDIGTHFQSLDPKPGSDEEGGWYNLYMYAWGGQEQGELIRGLDHVAENGGWYITMCHIIGPEMTDYTESTYSLSEHVFRYASELQEKGDVWVTTFGDATKYIRERQNTTVSYKEKDGVYTLSLTMAKKTADNLSLDPEIFNHPLTVEVSVPDGYAGAYYYENGVGRFAEAKEKDGKRYAYIDAMPNGDSVQLSFVKTDNEQKAPDLRGTLGEDGILTDGMGMISSVSRSKILLGISNVPEKTIAKANISLQFSGNSTENIRIWGVDATLAATMSEEQLASALSEATVSKDLVGSEPLFVIEAGERSAVLDACEYLKRCAGKQGLFLIDTESRPASGLTLLNVSIDTATLQDTVYYSESHLDLHHGLKIENELIYTVYFTPSENITAVYLDDTIYTQEQITALPTVKVDNKQLCGVSLPISFQDAASALPLRFEILTSDGSSAIVEPKLSVLAYLDALLEEEGDDEELRVMILDLMLLIRSSVQRHSVGSDVSAVGSALEKFDYSPLLTPKLIGAVAATLTTVEKVSLRLDGVPSFVITPKAGLSYTFSKPNGDRIEYTTETVDGASVYVLPIRTFHLFLPVTISATDASGKKTQESFHLANYFATLTGKEREVVKYAAAFAESFDAVRDKKE